MQKQLTPLTLLVVVALLLFLTLRVYNSVLAPQVLTVTVFSLGYDDENRAYLLQNQRRESLLIDTGSDAGILRALGVTLPMWKRNIEAVLLTSNNAKSRGGFDALSERYTVGDVQYFGTPERNFGTPLPYGTVLTFDTDTYIRVVAPQKVVVSYGNSSLSLSSTTPAGTYLLPES